MLHIITNIIIYSYNYTNHLIIYYKNYKKIHLIAYI